MKGVSKNIFLIAILILVNLAIFLFCWILTDEGNYIWSNTSQDRKLLVSMACLDLLRIKYFIYANSINVCLLGIYFAYYFQKRMGALLIVVGILIFWGGNKLFEENLLENYYIIFENQKVPEDFILEPVKSAGKGIGKYLMNDILDKQSSLRKYAIKGVGEVKYDPATESLNNILHDLTEVPNIRGEAYLSLLKMNTEKSASYARIFIGSIHPIADQGVIEYIKKAGMSL